MTIPPDSVSTEPWWAINGEEILAMLRRVQSGEDPDLVYAEAYVNSAHEDVPGES